MSVKAILTEQQKSYTKAEEDALLATKQNTLTFDDTPIQNSDNPVKSSGIKAVIDDVVSGVTPVALAENLTSDSTQSSADTFIERTTGGTASLSDGDGWIQVVRGSHTHIGYTAGNVNPVVTSASHSLSGTIDEQEFLAAVSDTSGTMEFFYTTNWNYDPASYGITITGTPLNGDSIVVTYDTTDVATVAMTIIPIYHSISAEVDKETFLAQMTSASGDMDFIYATNWNYDPTTYGITITGSPISGDQIHVIYVKEVRGTIIQSNPQTFKSSGWNLYNHTNGYARVLKYSEIYGFGIAGTYTSLAFSPTISGVQTSVTVTDGKFTIDEDGYIFITGGNDTDTQIWMTWSDWISQANGGTWEAYTESVVDFSSIMSSYFPYGLLEVGNYQDEINFSTGVAINKVARMAYSSANLATVRAMEVDYEYDENYIYYALSTPVSNSISIDNSFDAYDHGLEWFTGTTLAVDAQTIYGRNLKNKLERDVLTISQQDLTNSDIAQVKENLKMSYICNKNLLDNWYFVGGGTGRGMFPVNQRGKNNYNANGSYTIDRWRFNVWNAQNISATIDTTGITISQTATNANSIYLAQKIDGWQQYAGKTVTVSILVTSLTGSARAFLYGATDGTRYLSSSITVGLNTFTVTLSSDITGLQVAFGHHTSEGGRGAVTLTVSAIKLELGDQQTLAHQENGIWVLNEIPDYEEELIKCQTSTADPSDIYANKVISMNLSNKNLLDNWYFVGGGSQLGDGVFPINQRGRTQYSGSGKHFDRWGFGAAGGTLELLASGVKITVTSGSQSFSQNLSTSTAALYGRTVTVSALTAGGDLYYETGTLPNSAPSTTTTYISKNIPNVGSLSVVYAASSGRFNVNITNSSSSSQSITIAAMKLELGSEQTLCHQENGVWILNEIPDYSEELRNCQRYLFAIEQFVSLPLAGFGVARNTTTAVLQFPTPVTLRKATPTLSYSGTFKLWHGSVTSYDNALAVTGMAGVGLQSTSVNFGVSVASGLTSGEICMIQMAAGSKIIISVEL